MFVFRLRSAFSTVAELLNNLIQVYTFNVKKAKAKIIKFDWKLSVASAAACYSTSAIILQLVEIIGGQR